jgi:hypothetical protein
MNIAYELGWLFVFILLICSLYYASFHLKKILRIVAVISLSLVALICLRISVLLFDITQGLDLNSSAFFKLWGMMEDSMRSYYKQKTGMEL